MTEFRKGPESHRSEEPKFSASGRLQINDDFLFRNDHFRALLAADKPEAVLTDFRTLPETPRWRSNHCNSLLNRTYTPLAAAQTIVIPYSNAHGYLRWRSNHCNSLLNRTCTPLAAAQTIVIPCSNEHGYLRWRSNHCNSWLNRTCTLLAAGSVYTFGDLL